MIVPKATRQLSACCLAALLTFHAAHAQGPDAQLTQPEIHAQATEMYGKIESVKVSYNYARKQVFKPPADYEQGDMSEHVEFLLDSERSLMKVRGSDGSKSVTVFDGEVTHMISRGLVKQTSGKSPEVESELYVTEGLNHIWRDSDLLNRENAWFYPHVLRAGPGDRYTLDDKQEEVDGAWCHVLEMPGFDKLWVDTEAGCALRRRERSDKLNGDSYMVVRYHFQNLEKIDPGVWVPMTMKREFFASGRNPKQYLNKVAAEDVMEVESIELNGLQASDFDALVTPGMVVVTPTGENYRVPGSDPVALNALADAADTSTPSSRRWIPIGVSMVVILILVCFFLLRTQRDKRSPQRGKE